MKFSLPNGAVISDSEPFAITTESGASFRFPHNWLQLATDEDLAQWGISKVAEPEPTPEPEGSPE